MGPSKPVMSDPCDTNPAQRRPAAFSTISLTKGIAMHTHLFKDHLLAFGVAVTLGFAGAAGAQTPQPNPAPVIAQMQADHVELGVDNMDVMIDWYVRVLGFSVEKAWTVDELPGVRLAYLIHPSGWRVEFAAGVSGPRTPKAKDFAEAFQMRGLQHLAFRVTNVDAAVKAAVEQGASVLYPATDFPVGAERRVAFIQDPEGNLIEFAGPLAAAKR